MGYEIGKIYIWRNTPNVVTRLHGQETTVLSGPIEATRLSDGVRLTCWMTDTKGLRGQPVAATLGQLRLKNPPSGERSVLRMFNNPTLEPA